MDIMTKIKKHERPFSAAVDHYMRVQGWTNKEMGIAVGYTDGKMLSAIRLETSSGSEDMRREIAKKLGFTLDGLIKEGARIIQSQGGSVSDTHTNTQNIHPLNQHHLVFDQFQQKALALELNSLLLAIEQDSPEKLVLVRDVLAAFLPDQKKEGLKRRITDRKQG